MREIKFRAWDAERKRFLTNSFGISKLGQALEPGTGILYRRKIIISQYTGLKDKNGVEIYEGDRVNIKRSLVWHVGEVQWSDTVRGFIFHCHWENNPKYDYYGIRFKEVREIGEVIGNIYEKEA